MADNGSESDNATYSKNPRVRTYIFQGQPKQVLHKWWLT